MFMLFLLAVVDLIHPVQKKMVTMVQKVLGKNDISPEKQKETKRNKHVSWLSGRLHIDVD